MLQHTDAQKCDIQKVKNGISEVTCKIYKSRAEWLLNFGRVDHIVSFYKRAQQVQETPPSNSLAIIETNTNYNPDTQQQLTKRLMNNIGMVIRKVMNRI